jgi:hypothetical protein
LAEEIAVLYCLAKQGTIEATARRENVRDLEVIYTSRIIDTRVAIEVTAVSDRSYYEINPTEAFKEEVLRVTFKHHIHKFGGIRHDLGSVRRDRGPILGLPPAKELARFFQSPKLLQFIANIKKQPAQSHEMRFEYNQAKSRLYFVPGPAIGGGGHTVHTLLFDPHKNPITWRLDEKDKQIAKAKLDLPAVVVLCDADCHALHATRSSVGAQSAAQVIHTFLNVRAQSRRINGVVLWPVFSDYNLGSGKRPRYFTTPEIIRTVAQTHFTLDDTTLVDIAGAASQLPRIARAPLNARRKSKSPPYFGGCTIIPGNPMKIRMSLLSLQYLLSGHIPAGKFAEANADLMKQFKLATDRGLIISAVDIERSADEDDDWIEIKLEQTAPTHILKKPPAA